MMRITHTAITYILYYYSPIRSFHYWLNHLGGESMTMPELEERIEQSESLKALFLKLHG